MENVFMITEEQLKVWQATYNVTDSQMNELKISSQAVNNEDYVILQIAKDISLNQPNTSITNVAPAGCKFARAFARVACTAARSISTASIAAAPCSATPMARMPEPQP